MPNDDVILAALDVFEWRNMSKIRAMLKFQGEGHRILDALRRLTAAGFVEQMKQDTGVKRLPNTVSTDPVFRVELYRRL